MIQAIHILAAGDSNLIEFIFVAVVVVASWLYQLAKNFSKWNEEQQKKRQGVQVTPPPARTEPVQAARPTAKVVRGQRVVNRGARAKVAPVIQAVVASKTTIAPPIEVSRPATGAASANAASIKAWLRPGTLRRQFILTEVLQPPLGLRGNDERHAG